MVVFLILLIQFSNKSKSQWNSNYLFKQFFTFYIFSLKLFVLIIFKIGAISHKILFIYSSILWGGSFDPISFMISRKMMVLEPTLAMRLMMTITALNMTLWVLHLPGQKTPRRTISKMMLRMLMRPVIIVGSTIVGWDMLQIMQKWNKRFTNRNPYKQEIIISSTNL